MARIKTFKYARGYSFGRPIAKHIAVAERALGKMLPPGAVVHHVDENGLNNAPSNLVVCPDEAYHNALHRRMRAQAECGNPNYEKCSFCKSWDDPTKMSSVQKSDRPSITYWHAACQRAYKAAKKLKKDSL